MRSAFFFLAAGVLSAQEAPISGPVEGITFDLPTLSLRPVIGSLGSASLGNPILRGVSSGSAAPRQDYALTFENEHCSLVMGLGSPQSSTVRGPGMFPLPEGVVWSSDGSTAVLFSRTGSWIQILSGMPSTVQPGPSVSGALLGGTLSGLAIDSHGSRIVTGIVGENSG